MSALICGSFAYDTIMVFHDKFKNHILPDKVHMLNVSFLVPELRREFGGCAGNIAFNLKLLGGEPYPMGTIGSDFAPYSDWMNKFAISDKYLKQVSTYTAQAFITTDEDDNQITAFHPGAMNYAHENSIPDSDGIRVGMVAPDGRDGMLQHAEQFEKAGIPFIFDPGQGLPMFDGAELLSFIEKATWVAVNEYESKMLEERTGKTHHEIAEMVQALIITKGSGGSLIYTKNHRYEIPTAKVANIIDPTGCGDAYRAGILYGILNDLDWDKTGRIASLLGAIKIESHGTQNHVFTMDEFKQRFASEFGMDF
ncbi:Sugar kinase [hydrothermal vent metagenome]|uniref:Sugar kinase n=1 Tax=hydrothermal vent metagenome TaxID=652676 RepID=A0A3B1A1D3_9ZZZZ